MTQLPQTLQPVDSREKAHASARSSELWRTIEAGSRALTSAGQSHEIRLKVILSSARLGLRTMALEQMALLPAAVQQDSDLLALRRELEKLSSDLVTTRMLEQTLTRNLEVLALRGIDLRTRVTDWAARAARLEVFKAQDGNLIWRRTSGEWLGISDQRGIAESLQLTFLGPNGTIDPSKPPKPIVLEGIDPPWLFLRLWRATPAMADGYRPTILIVQHDLMELMDGLASMDLREQIADQRVRWFIGAQARDEMREWLHSRLDLAMPHEYLVNPGLRTAASAPSVPDVVRELHRLQQNEHHRLQKHVAEIYQGRNREWWGRRYAQARSGGPPLRILIPISRFSTFVKHSAADLADALIRQGHETRLLSEPDDSSRLVTSAYLRQFSDWQPDLVVLINFTRLQMRDAVPAEIPFVCWIQDRMPHLFDEKMGRANGPLDFVVGHLHPELFDLFHWPRARRHFAFVPANPRKFHDGSRGESGTRWSCDIAYVSHQSEPPEAAHQKLRLPFAGQPLLANLIDQLHERLCTQAREGPREAHGTIIRALFIKAGVNPPDERLVNTIGGNYAVPLAERLHRHITLEWVAEIARRRGWQLRLHGRGWELHPTLREFAAPPVEHDEDLRTLYQAARVNLHISRNSNAHQRVAECALSGGLMLRRGPSPDHGVAHPALLHHLFAEMQPSERTEAGDLYFDLPEGQFPEPRLFQIPELRFHTADGDGHRIWRLATHTDRQAWLHQRHPRIDLRTLPDFAMPRSRETLFESKSELETMLERAITDPIWRSEMVREQRDWALREASTDRLASDLIRLIPLELGGAA